MEIVTALKLYNSLLNIEYELTLGHKGILKKLRIIFDKSCWFHLAGIHYPNDIDMSIDAASAWILGELEEGNSIPSATPFFEVQLDDPNCFKSVISLDMNAYAEKYSTKTVRKNITIPAWLNTYGEKNNINFSKVLQDALLKQAESQTQAK